MALIDMKRSLNMYTPTPKRPVTSLGHGVEAVPIGCALPISMNHLLGSQRSRPAGSRAPRIDNQSLLRANNRAPERSRVAVKYIRYAAHPDSLRSSLTCSIHTPLYYLYIIIYLNMAVDFVAQLQDFRDHDARRDSLLAQLVKDFHELQARLNEATVDLQDEKKSRRFWQKHAEENESIVNEQKLSLNSNNFVVVLIDGDGALVSGQVNGLVNVIDRQ
jgi:hypothetical protein